MKEWLVFILLVITTAGTFVPCCQFDDCTGQTASTNGHENHRREGTCSPFVICGTCAGFTHLAKTPEIPAILFEKTSYHSGAATFLLSAYATSLFQPPRIA